MEPPKKKRKVLTLEEKANIIRAVASGRKKCDVAVEHGIPASTLSTSLKAKDAIVLATSSGNASKKKHLKTTPHEKLEEALFMWCNYIQARNVPLSGEVVQKKALGYACLLGFDEFKASPGWLSRFKEHYGIVGKVSSQARSRQVVVGERAGDPGEVATDQNFDDFVNADADADTDTTEVLDGEEIVQLVSGAQEESEDANDPDAVEAPMPTPSQVMDAVNILSTATITWRLTLNPLSTLACP
ncbi:hypothetical protein HPB47_007044 [Ixodes persulcatus]|uniref:Uncharacterized protein n=1 Tax=Ixodes persulcatus TaxID=34615 RepID=A0AC60P8R3_IXOPE|nr:hypothetical protein HPB47_007044 [Ixodes persulcatus]